jgi:hypothetical protein
MFVFFCFLKTKITNEPVHFTSILSNFKINHFASLRYLIFFTYRCSLRFEINLLTIAHVRFASLESQFANNLVRYDSIFHFPNINMFASLRKKHLYVSNVFALLR